METVTKAKKKIGENIKKIRLASNKESKEVSKDLNLSIAAYSNIERGVTDISISRILQIANYFNVHFSEILAIDNTTSYYFTPNNNSTGTQNNNQFSKQSSEGFTIAIDQIMKENTYLKNQNNSLIQILAVK
jgi:transcriptional regulator with XRE-family HTH domain